MFNSGKVKAECVEWIKDWFACNGDNCKAVIGISGGVDSTVVAALCVEALGRDRVIGVLMPNGKQDDIDYAYQVCDCLRIKRYVINIESAFRSILSGFINEIEISDQTRVNLPSRIRMATLYAVSQSVNGRVANTCNLSEDWIGYSTRYGDSVGDFSPLSKFTKTEVVSIGSKLGIEKRLLEKTPSDGLCGKTDEENFGFTYKMLDKYIRTGICDDRTVKERIDHLHKKNKFKLELMPFFDYKSN